MEIQEINNFKTIILLSWKKGDARFLRLQTFPRLRLFHS